MKSDVVAQALFYFIEPCLLVHFIWAKCFVYEMFFINTLTLPYFSPYVCMCIMPFTQLTLKCQISKNIPLTLNLDMFALQDLHL